MAGGPFKPDSGLEVPRLRSGFRQRAQTPANRLNLSGTKCSLVTDVCSLREQITFMPWGLKRFHETGQSHFVTFCCYHRHQLFTCDADRRIFESALERVSRSFVLRVYGYVVMPDHVHLLLSEPGQQTLADALKSLKQGVARRLIRNLPLKPESGLNGPPRPSEGPCVQLNFGFYCRGPV